MKELQRRGRPKLDKESAKSQIIQVRMTFKETKIIEDYCEQNNFTISNLLRESLSRLINE
jgi:dephospho-CoA kinase